MWYSLMILEKHMTHATQLHILKTVELVGTATNIIEQLKRSIQSWRTVLLSGKNRLGKVKIRRVICQGDSLSPLLFVVALIPITVIPRTLE